MYDLTSRSGIFCRYCDQPIDFVYRVPEDVADEWMHVGRDLQFLFCRQEDLREGLNYGFKATPEIEHPQKAI